MLGINKIESETDYKCSHIRGHTLCDAHFFGQAKVSDLYREACAFAFYFSVDQEAIG